MKIIHYIYPAGSETIGSKGSQIAIVKKTEVNFDLIERAKSNPDAFGELYELYYCRILNYMYRRIPDVAAAEELTSNTFFKVLKALPKYRKITTFNAWIYRIATNEIYMYFRSAKNRTNREKNYYTANDLDRIFFSSSGIEEQEDKEEKNRFFMKLHGFLNELPEIYKTVLVLRYFEELKINEIAQVLGKRPGTVKSLIHRGLKRLRVEMNQLSATNP